MGRFRFEWRQVPEVLQAGLAALRADYPGRFGAGKGAVGLSFVADAGADRLCASLAGNEVTIRFGSKSAAFRGLGRLLAATTRADLTFSEASELTMRGLMVDCSRNGVLRPAGISTFGREIEWAAPRGNRKASPDGHRLGEVLATNFSPSPGTDRLGPTAALKSYCKMDFTRTPNGATLELKMHPSAVQGERGLEALVGLLRALVQLGGFYLHVDVVDSAMLIDAQRHPEKYPNLAVRISGCKADGPLIAERLAGGGEYACAVVEP